MSLKIYVPVFKFAKFLGFLLINLGLILSGILNFYLLKIPNKKFVFFTDVQSILTGKLQFVSTLLSS